MPVFKGVIIFSSRKQLDYSIKAPDPKNLKFVKSGPPDADLSSSFETSSVELQESAPTRNSRSSGIADIFAKLKPVHCTPQWLQITRKEFGRLFAARTVSDLVHNRDGKGALNIMIEKFKNSALKHGLKFDREKVRKTIVSKFEDAALEKAGQIFQQEYQRLMI